MVTDADRLVAAGAPLTIAGHDLHVRYTPRSLKMMEDKYGSIQAAGEQLQEIQQGKGKIVSFTFSILSMGLQHESIDGVKVDENWLLDNGDVKQLRVYAEAAFEALAEALPDQPADPTPPAKNGTNGSTGHRTSGSRSRTSTAALPSSGTE